MVRTSLLVVFFGSLAFGQQFAGFDLGSLNRSVDPCADFYKFSCGGWQTKNPLPSDQARYGSFDALQDRNRIVLQNLLETTSSNKPGRSPLEQKEGDFYAACMDEKAIDARGTAALKPDLDRIAALKNKKDLAEVLAHLFRSGASPFFNFGSEQDAKDSTKVIAAIGQGGLGLPDRDYYFKTDAKSVEERKQYVAHVQKMFELLGSSPAEAAMKAQTVMTIETALAEGSLDNVSLRDPEKTYHKMTVTELVSSGSGFRMGQVLQGRRRAVAAKFGCFRAGFLQGLQRRDRPHQPGRSENLSDLASGALQCFDSANGLRAGELQLLRQDPARRQGTSSALEALRGYDRSAASRRAGQDLRRKNVGRRRQAAHAEDGRGDWRRRWRRTFRQWIGCRRKPKQQAMVKLHAITNKIGNKAHWLDYANVKVSRDDAFGNSERASEFELARQLGKIGKPVDKTDWDMSQPTVNAYYDPQENDINFPAGILQAAVLRQQSGRRGELRRDRRGDRA